MTKQMRAILLSITAGLMLAGCKIEVPVPSGGYVTTQSGVFTCNAGQTCIIKANDLTFDETFIAVPDNGMKFVRWEKRDRGFFGGSTNDTARLFTSGFEDNDILMSFLKSDETFYLEPVFETSLSTNEQLARLSPSNFRRYQGTAEIYDLWQGTEQAPLNVEERILTSSYTLGSQKLLLSSVDIAISNTNLVVQSHFYQDGKGALITIVNDAGNYYYRPDLEQYGVLDIPSPLEPNTSTTFDYEIRDSSDTNIVLFEGRKTIYVEPKQTISTPLGTFSAYPVRTSDWRQEQLGNGYAGDSQEAETTVWIVAEIGMVGFSGRVAVKNQYGSLQQSLSLDYRLTGKN